MSRRTIVLILAALSMLLLAWQVAVSFEENRLAGIMQTQLDGKSAELDRQLTQYAVVPRLLSRNPTIVEALTSSDKRSVAKTNQTLLSAQKDSNAAFAFVMDLQGNTLASSNYLDDISFVGRNYGFRPYFKDALVQPEATFFAVGATTGVPGYFVAHPIVHGHDAVVGVVVVKFELSGLLDSWELLPYEWLALDEFGVVILATNDTYLYARTQPVSTVGLAQIAQDRRYTLSRSAFDFSGSTGRFSGVDIKETLFVQRKNLLAEDWQLQLMVARSYINFRVLLYLLTVLLLLAIAALVYRNIQSQKRLAVAEKRYARQLEVEVKQRTEELHAAQQTLISESNFAMLGRMSGAINHEINQPLASLRLNLASLRKLIEQPYGDMAEIRQVVVDSDRTTKRIGRVIATLRNLTSQSQAHHSQLKPARLIDEVVETIHRERPAMSQSMSVVTEEPLADIMGNEILLQQAVLNLLYNAFDAVIDEVRPHVKVVLKRHEQFVNIEVSDNGCGLSEVVTANLFKPFVSDKTRKSGLGLGLTLAELIAKDHGGSLHYRPASDIKNEGSIFTLSLPALAG